MCFCFFVSSRRRHTRCALVTGVQTCALPICSDVSPPLGDEPWADVWLAPEQASAQFFGMIHLYPGRAWRRTALFSFDPFEKGRSLAKTPEYPSSLFHSAEKTGPPPGPPARNGRKNVVQGQSVALRIDIGGVR